MNRRKSSMSFSVSTVSDGQDGVVYEIVSSVGSVTIPSDASAATLSTNLSFYRRAGSGARETYSCYYAIFRKKGSGYTLLQRSTSKVKLVNNVSFDVEESNTDAIVVCMYDASATTHSGYLTELEIPVRKNGDDGKDAAQLVFEPAVVYVPCDSDGMSIESVNEDVAFFIEIDGTRYEPDSNTATAQKVGQDIDYTFSDNKTILNVDIGSGYSDIEGYIKVTATKTLNGVPYTASGCLPVVANLQGETGGRGLTGRMFRFRGKYVDGTEYTADSNYVDVVFFDDGTYNADRGYGKHFYINYGSASTNKNGSTYYAPASSDRDGNTYSYKSGVWAEAADFGLVITQGIFAEFAKMGSAVMSGDYLFSQNGYFDGVAKNNGAEWKGVPAYTLFQGDPDALALKAEGAKSLNTTYSDFTGQTSGIALEKGEVLLLKLTTGTLTGTVRIRMYSVTGTAYSFQYSTSATSSTWTTVSSSSYLTLSANNTYYIKFTASATYGYQLCAAVSSGTGLLNFTLSRLMFIPNRWDDLRTGKLSAARENFVVDASGNVMVKGTIRATNFYHSNCVYRVGGTYSTGGEDTGDADMVFLVPKTNNYTDDNNDSSHPGVQLPDPATCIGKLVEVHPMYYGSTVPTYFICCSARKNNARESVFVSNVYMKDNGQLDKADSPADRVTRNADRTARFLAMQTDVVSNGRTCWWVAVD